MKSRSTPVLVLLFLIICSTTELLSQTTTTFVCNDLVHISLGNDCEGFITIDEVLEDDNLNPTNFVIEISENNGTPVANPVTGNYIGQTLTVHVIEISTTNSCWANILIEDKFPPNITCTNISIECFDNPDDAPLPIVQDNCDANPILHLVDEVIDNDDYCNGVTITRTYLAEDASGNLSNPCNQTITIGTPPPVTFPDPISLACAAVQGDSMLLNPINTGFPNIGQGLYCPYTVTYADDLLPECGASYKLLRSFSVMNWCTGQIITQGANGNNHVQAIEVLDNIAPQIELGAYEVSINVAEEHPNACNSQGFLQPATVSDNCSDWTVSIFTPVGEANYIGGNDGKNGGFIPSPGLELGDHEITYVATDECGNFSELIVTIIVEDNTAPTPVCDEITSVSLTSGTEVIIHATVFDDGSYDDCCLDFFEVRRLSDACGVGGNEDFGPTVTFCCADVEQPDVSVEVRIHDCAGNVNLCTVQVDLEDKLSATLVSCPEDTTILCDYFMDDLMGALLTEDFEVFDPIFGMPVFEDNCTVLVGNPVFTENIDECATGTITRTWLATDASNSQPAVCTQNIVVEHVSDWVVEFPEDILVECGDELPATGEPEIFFKTCELTAISFEDTYFDIVQDACFKIVRSWTVINWCTVNATFDDLLIEDAESVLGVDLNGQNGQNDRTFQDGLNVGNYNQNVFINGALPDGIVKYEQVIKGNDSVVPIIECPTNLSFCVIDNTCTTTIELPEPTVFDCSFELSITAETVFGTGMTIQNVPPGNFEVLYQVSDNCGNSNACQTTFEVRDCKFPTPNCVNALIIELGDNGGVTINAQDFDAGSFDNCPGDLSFSYSTNITDSLETFDCFNLGFGQLIEIYLTDAAGNQTFCETVIFVQDNMGACMGNPLIAGTVETPFGDPISGVSLAINDSNSTILETTDNGQFLFEELENGGDFTLTPEKDYFDLNGVSTFDLVIISKHILGTQLMTNPYQMIAADANKSNSISTLDLVQIRKLVLHIDDTYANNTSWRFFDKYHVFDNPNQPFLDMPLEVLDFNNLTDELLNVDFVGVKIGDVNDNANPLELTASDDRIMREALIVSVDNQHFAKGDVISIPFEINTNDVLGYQFTIDFDHQKLAFLSIEEGLAKQEHFGFSKKEEGAITTSWNGTIAAEKTRLFTAVFQAKTTGELKNNVTIESSYTTAEAYNKALETLEIQLAFNSKKQPINIQNAPNPFVDKTTFSCPLTVASPIKVFIQNVSGEVVFEESINGQIGDNKVSINKEDLIHAGMYFYRIMIGEKEYVGKMICL